MENGRGRREEGGLPREGVCGMEAAEVGSLKHTNTEDTEQGQQGRRGKPGGIMYPEAHAPQRHPWPQEILRAI